MLVEFNRTFRFTKQFDDLSQEDIARTPPVPSGESTETILAMSDMPDSVKRVIRELPYPTDRKYVWVYVRPQWVDIHKPDSRTGAFYHADVDAIYRCVAPNWYDFKEVIVTFGDIAEPQFISESLSLEVDPVVRSSDYVTLSPHFNNRDWPTETPRNGQVVEYTMRDIHRAGPMRRTGWRLVIVCFATDAEPVKEWK